MKKHFALVSLILLLILLTTSCTNKKEIETQIKGLERQIQMIDAEISQLEQKKGKLTSLSIGEMRIQRKIDPEIKQLERAREVLLIKLESLYQQL